MDDKSIEKHHLVKVQAGTTVKVGTGPVTLGQDIFIRVPASMINDPSKMEPLEIEVWPDQLGMGL